MVLITFHVTLFDVIQGTKPTKVSDAVGLRERDIKYVPAEWARRAQRPEGSKAAARFPERAR